MSGFGDDSLDISKITDPSFFLNMSSLSGGQLGTHLINTNNIGTEGGKHGSETRDGGQRDYSLEM
jgi:hypothetical protein